MASYVLFSGLCFALAARAAPETSPSPDDCDDPSGWQSMEELLQTAPRDELVIRLYALRLGLCQLIKARKIDSQVGIDMFEAERQRAIGRRALEEQQAQRPSAKPL